MIDFDALAAEVVARPEDWIPVVPEGKLGSFRNKLVQELNTREVYVRTRLDHLGLQVRRSG